MSGFDLDISFESDADGLGDEEELQRRQMRGRDEVWGDQVERVGEAGEGGGVAAA